jgi:hypothetical protein
MINCPDVYVPVVITKDPQMYGSNYLSQQIWQYKENVKCSLHVTISLPSGSYVFYVEPYDDAYYIQSKMENGRYSIP